MSVPLVKDKLLAVAHSGAYASFTPTETRAFLRQLDVFIKDHGSDRLTPLEYYDLLELQFYLLLIASEDKKAKQILDQLKDQFTSKDSQRLKLMTSMYLEAVGNDSEAMEALKGNRDEMRLGRRMVTFARKLDNGKGEDNPSNDIYISNLVAYLNMQPLDLMAWDELALEYSKVGAYDKSVFALEEIVLQDPLAYGCFHKIGLNSYYLALQLLAAGNQAQQKKEKIIALVNVLTNARDNWLRAIEIFPKYTKSWVGIYLVLNEAFLLKLSKYTNLKEVELYIRNAKRLVPKAEATIKKLEGISEDSAFHELVGGV